MILFRRSKTRNYRLLNWFCYPPYKYKILIAGNHDDFLWDSEIEFLHENCYGLSYSCVTIEGVKFHGIPMFVQDCVSGLINTGIEKIRPDTDVLITHCPPFEILDFDNNIHYGSKELLTAVEKSNHVTIFLVIFMLTMALRCMAPQPSSTLQL